MASARSASPNGDPSGVPGHPTEAESFCLIFIQKVAKSSRFKRKLAPCLRETALRSHDQPEVLVIGGSARSAHRPLF